MKIIPRDNGPLHAAVRGLAGAALLVALTLSACERQAEKAAAAAAEVAKETSAELVPMPEFQLASLGGEQVAKKDLLGKVVLFDFWATWCGPCHLQADILREMYPDAARRGFEFIAISSGEEPATVREFASRKPFPYAVLVDPEEILGLPLEVNVLPTLMVMDRKGRISYRHTGIADAAAIDAALRAADAAPGA